ncbi:HAD-IA family hydrolase [candidate division KSB1 bacterium]|nr:HAD-IA family hydrolase [candidate division KSB1 bacterium]
MKVSSKAKGLIFDCDGTLADTMPIHWQAWREAFMTFGADCPLEFLKELSGIPSERIVSHFNARFEKDFDVKSVALYKNELVRDKLLFANPIVPVVEIVKTYKGKLPMAVASGGTKLNVNNTIKAIGLEGFFKAIITADNKVKPKPSPDIYLEAAKRINVPPKFCQVFEDGNAGVESAKKAGMMVTDIRLFI